jgi:hypothetical protein
VTGPLNDFDDYFLLIIHIAYRIHVQLIELGNQFPFSMDVPDVRVLMLLWSWGSIRQLRSQEAQ